MGDRGDGVDAAIDTHNNEWNWSHENGLTVLMHLRLMVESTILSTESLYEEGLVSHASQSNNHHHRYRKITTFINPINGTRKFSMGMGRQCSVCIRFVNGEGRAVVGVVYCPVLLSGGCGSLVGGGGIVPTG